MFVVIVSWKREETKMDHKSVVSCRIIDTKGGGHGLYTPAEVIKRSTWSLSSIVAGPVVAAFLLLL